MTDLKVVPIATNTTLRVGTLHDRMVGVINEYVTQQKSNGQVVVNAEIVGTLEYVKAHFMGVYK